MPKINMAGAKKVTDGGMNFHRQLDFFNPQDYEDELVEIFGAGGVGSFLAFGLAKLGFKRIRVWDADVVSDHNLPNQCFFTDSLGQPKVEAVKKVCRSVAGAEIEVRNEFWTPDKGIDGSIVVSAVDSMAEVEGRAGRKEIWNACKMNINVKLFMDARLGGEVFRILSLRPVNDCMKHGWYEGTLVSNDKMAETPCTARSIIDVAFVVTAVLVRGIRKFLKSGEVSHDVIIDWANLSIMKAKV
jgi:hypothetical protein